MHPKLRNLVGKIAIISLTAGAAIGLEGCMTDFFNLHPTNPRTRTTSSTPNYRLEPLDTIIQKANQSYQLQDFYSLRPLIDEGVAKAGEIATQVAKENKGKIDPNNPVMIGLNDRLAIFSLYRSIISLDKYCRTKRIEQLRYCRIWADLTIRTIGLRNGGVNNKIRTISNNLLILTPQELCEKYIKQKREKVRDYRSHFLASSY